jgi:hypothetical protein
MRPKKALLEQHSKEITTQWEYIYTNNVKLLYAPADTTFELLYDVEPGLRPKQIIHFLLVYRGYG